MKNRFKRVVFFEKYKKRVRRIISKKIKDFKDYNIVIFGITEISQVAVNEIIRNGGRVEVVVDNDPMWWGTNWMNIAVKSPDVLREENNWFVISCTPYVYDKKCQLHTLGIDKNRYIFIEPEKGILIKKLVRVFFAWNTYKKLSRQYGEKLFLCPYPGTGDAYLTGRYLPNLIDKLNWSEYTILVTGNAFKKVMELYGYNNCVVIDKIVREDLEWLIANFGSEKFGIHYLLYWGLSIQNTFRLENGNSFHDIFKYTVFGECEKKVYEPLFSNDYEMAEKLLERMHLIKGKTVILSPFANSFEEELSLEWWEKLAQKIKQKGYTVVTNCGSEKEIEIKGTERLQLSYREFAPVAELCGYLVGIRSGFFDLMSGINCKKIIVYQDFMSRERADFFSLVNMGLCEDAIELKLNASSEGKECLANKILQIMG